MVGNPNCRQEKLDPAVLTELYEMRQLFINMPPSGFYRKHSEPISAFFRACVDDLIAENKGVRTPEQAIQRELNHIKFDTTSTKRDAIPTKILELTRDFYDALLKKKSLDYGGLEEHSEELIALIEREIEAIKVADPV